MQTKHASMLKHPIQIFFSLLSALILFSCSKSGSTNTVLKNETVAPTLPTNASDRTSSVTVPFDQNVFVPCANDGAGEYVHITGSTNLVYTISWTDHGFTYGYHGTAYRVQGVGLTTGATFVGSGNTEGQVMGAWVNEQWLSTFVDNLRLVNNNTSFILKSVYHVSVSPNGDAVVSLDSQTAECR